MSRSEGRFRALGGGQHTHPMFISKSFSWRVPSWIPWTLKVLYRENLRCWMSSWTRTRSLNLLNSIQRQSDQKFSGIATPYRVLNPRKRRKQRVTTNSHRTFIRVSNHCISRNLSHLFHGSVERDFDQAREEIPYDLGRLGLVRIKTIGLLTLLFRKSCPGYKPSVHDGSIYRIF
jgi:hypothetical protein